MSTSLFLCVLLLLRCHHSNLQLMIQWDAAYISCLLCPPSTYPNCPAGGNEILHVMTSQLSPALALPELRCCEVLITQSLQWTTGLPKVTVMRLPLGSRKVNLTLSQEGWRAVNQLLMAGLPATCSYYVFC